MPAPTRKIAVLIDGDNAESKLIEHILDAAGKHGTTTIKRAYGDWSEPQLKSWREKLNAYAIRPIQKFAYTKGKNSTDSELIIDAMDILHSRLVDGFCIVSSDSDYTGLANRIREAGMFIMGIGRSKTPEAFVKACETFTYTEVLESRCENKQPEKNAEQNTEQDKTTAAKQPDGVGKQIIFKPIGTLQGIKSIRRRDIDNAFDSAVDESTGLAHFPRFLAVLKQTDPTFDYRNFGFSSFRKFCENLAPTYAIEVHKDGSTTSLKKTE